MTKIVIGFDGTSHSQDALAFGQLCAKSTNGKLIIAVVLPTLLADSRVDDMHALDFNKRADAILATADELLDQNLEVEKQIVAGTSPGHGLHTVAVEQHANLLVVGGTNGNGQSGHLIPSKTGEGLLHHSPCAVALVPNGYRNTVPDKFSTIGVAYDGSEQATTALRSGIALARLSGAELKLIAVNEPILLSSLGFAESYSYSGDLARSSHEIMEKFLEEAQEQIPSGVKTSALLLNGHPVQMLSEQSKQLDLLITGSRGYGPLRGLLAGSVSRKLMHKALSPILLTPRGVENVFEPTSP